MPQHGWRFRVTHSLDPSNVRAYRRRAVPLLLPAYLLVIAGIGALLNPDAAERTTVARLLPSYIEAIWQGAYILGGILIAYGAMRPRPAIEIVGAWLALYALGLNLVALIVVAGVAGAGIAPFAYVLTLSVLALRISDLHSAAKTPPAWPKRLERRRSDYGRNARGRT